MWSIPSEQTHPAVRWGLSGLLYCGCLVAVYAALNADTANWHAALPALLVGSAVVGAITRDPAAASLALLAIPIAVPFGDPEHFMGEENFPVWWIAVGYLGPSAAAIAGTAVGIRWLAARSQRRTREAERSDAETTARSTSQGSDTNPSGGTNMEATKRTMRPSSVDLWDYHRS